MSKVHLINQKSTVLFFIVSGLLITGLSFWPIQVNGSQVLPNRSTSKESISPNSPSMGWSLKIHPHDGVPSFVNPYIEFVTWGGSGYEELFIGTVNYNDKSTIPAGISHSKDFGESWHHLTTILDGGNLSALITHPVTPTIMFAGIHTHGMAEKNGLYKSVDSGRNWENIYPVANVQSIVVDPLMPNRIYIENYGWFYQSKDSGKTWEVGIDNGGEAIAGVKDIAVDPTNSKLYLLTDRRFKVSLDMGETWEFDDTFYPYRQNHILINPANPDQIFLYGGSYSGIHRSDDGGEQWLYVGDTLPGIISSEPTVLSLFVDPNSPNILWLGLKYGGMYVSYDSGSSWQPKSFGIDFGKDIYGSFCTTGAIRSDGQFGVGCDGKFYIYAELSDVYLPFVSSSE